MSLSFLQSSQNFFCSLDRFFWSFLLFLVAFLLSLCHLSVSQSVVWLCVSLSLYLSFHSLGLFPPHTILLHPTPVNWFTVHVKNHQEQYQLINTSLPPLMSAFLIPIPSFSPYPQVSYDRCLRLHLKKLLLIVHLRHPIVKNWRLVKYLSVGLLVK